MDLQRLMAALSVCMKEEKRNILEYYEAEIRFLLNHLPKRPTATVPERMSMARAAIKVGRKNLQDTLNLFSVNTLFAWHRELIRKKWDYSKQRGPGRPSTMPEIEKWIVQLAEQNRGWGYTKIVGVV